MKKVHFMLMTLCLMAFACVPASASALTTQSHSMDSGYAVLLHTPLNADSSGLMPNSEDCDYSHAVGSNLESILIGHSDKLFQAGGFAFSVYTGNKANLKPLGGGFTHTGKVTAL